MTKLFSSVHDKLGLVVDSQEQSWRVGNFNLKTVVQLVQSTEFEHGKADESFNFVIENEKAILQGYHINSMDLITK